MDIDKASITRCYSLRFCKIFLTIYAMKLLMYLMTLKNYKFLEFK